MLDTRNFQFYKNATVDQETEAKLHDRSWRGIRKGGQIPCRISTLAHLLVLAGGEAGGYCLDPDIFTSHVGIPPFLQAEEWIRIS